MATSTKIGFISDSEMEKISPTPKGFISDEQMMNIESSSAPKDRKASAALEGFGEGATLGYLNNLQAATEKPVFKILNMITGQEVEPDDYLKARDYYNKRQETLQKENPKSFAAGQVAGTIASSIPVAKAAQGATMLARAGQAAKAGAAYGALQNTSENEGELGGVDVGERLSNAAIGAAVGAGSSVGTDLIGKGIKSAGNVKNTIGNKLKTTAENLAENATGATRVQSEKFSEDAGRYLLDNKIVQFADDAEKIAARSSDAIKKSENVIDSSLKALDESGVRVSQDKIVAGIQNKISELSKDPSQSDVVRKLNTIINDIIETGDSSINASSAEQIKRGFNKMAKNWQDPEKGQAGKIAYRAYRDAVEETAKDFNPSIASQFKEAKQVYGKLSPIQDAAEKRALQLSQSPKGGFLDLTSMVAGGAAGDPSGGVLTAVGRRVLAPKLSSSMAVTADSISKKLLSNPSYADLAQKNPEAFKATVFGVLEKLKPNEQLTGYAKWENDGAEKLQQHDSALSKDQIEQLKKTKKGRDLLIRASDLKPKSKAMDNLVGQIKEIEDN